MKIHLEKEERNKLIKRVLLTLIGVLFMGFSLSVLKIIDWGLDSYTYMNTSIAEKIGWTFGNWQLLLNIFLFIPVILWGRKYLGIGTIFNMVLVGYTVDFCSWIWQKTGLSDGMPETMWVRIPVMIVMLTVFVFAVAVYLSTDMGASPFDALPQMFCERYTKIPFFIVRFFWDLAAIVIGFVLSRHVGIVTILMMLFLGKTISFVKEKVDKVLK